MKQTLLISTLFLGGYLAAEAQDTLTPSQNYTCKLGIKTLIERSSLDIVQTSGSRSIGVVSGGLQAIFKMGKSKSSIESGVYYLNRGDKYYWTIPCGSECYIAQYLKITYGNLHIPFNYRLDTKYVYFAAGVYFDYLLKTSVSYEELPGALPYTYGTDRKLNFGWDISLGYEQSVSKTLSLFAEAELSCNLTEPKTEDGVWGFAALANYGIAFGINYKFLRKN